MLYFYSRSVLEQSSLILGLCLSEILSLLLLFSAVLIYLFLLFTSSEMDTRHETFILVSYSLVYAFSSSWTSIARGWISDGFFSNRCLWSDYHRLILMWFLWVVLEWNTMSFAQCPKKLATSDKVSPPGLLPRFSQKRFFSWYFRTAVLFYSKMLRQKYYLFKKQNLLLFAQ